MRIDSSIVGIGALALCCALASPGAAQDDALQGDGDPSALGRNTAERSTEAGVFLRFAESPNTHTHKVAVDTHVGFDSNREGAVIDTRAEAVLFSRRSFGLAVFGGGSYIGATSRFDEASSVNAGLKLQPLSQARHGIDGAFTVAYQSRGFNLQPAVAAELLLARRWGNTQALLNVGYGHGLEEGERYGTARGAVLTRVWKELRAGVDGRFLHDLEFDADEPEGEPELEANAGAVVSYAISHFALSLHAGPAFLRYRPQPDAPPSSTMIGAMVGVGIGATL